MAVKMIQVENLTTSRVGIPLSDGSHLSLLPKTKHLRGHISKPFDSELFPNTQSNQRMIQNGIIGIIEL